MKTGTKKFNFNFTNKSKKSRLTAVKLALQSDVNSQNIVQVADKIEKYISDGL